MAAPLVVSNEVIGAAVFLHCSDPDFFSEDLAAKATILAGQLGSLLEAGRLTQVSREQHRRAQILVEVAQTLHSMTDAKAVVEAVADRLRVLLRTRLVCIMLRQGGSFALHAVAAESAPLAASARAKHDRKGLQFAADLASRAVGAGEPVAVPIDPATHALGSLVPAGMLIAAPFRTSQTEGAVLVYPRQRIPTNCTNCWTSPLSWALLGNLMTSCKSSLCELPIFWGSVEPSLGCWKRALSGYVGVRRAALRAAWSLYFRKAQLAARS